MTAGIDSFNRSKMKEYKSIVLNGYTTKPKLDSLLKEYADQGFIIHSTIMGNILIMERGSRNIHVTSFMEFSNDTKDSDNIGYTLSAQSNDNT